MTTNGYQACRVLTGSDPDGWEPTLPPDPVIDLLDDGNVRSVTVHHELITSHYRRTP